MASEIGRIESEIILNRIQRFKEKVTLQYINNRFPVIVEDIAGAQLVVRRIEPSEELLLVGRSVQLFFEFQGAEMTILPRVVRDQGEQIDLAIEKPAYRDISRTFERIYNDSSIRIMALDESGAAMPKYPHTTRTIPQQKMEKYTEGLPSDPSSLIQSYFSALQKQDAIAKIVLFREHPPAHFAEKVSAYLGYPLIVPYPESDTQALSIPSRSSIEKAIRKMKIPFSGTMLKDQHRIPGFDSADTQIIVPIIHLTYCVGYAFVATHSLNPSQCEAYIQIMERYACALAIVLDRSGYFADLVRSKETARNLRLINISASGLRFSYKAAQGVYQQGDTIRLVISLPWHEAQREFLVDSRIVHNDSHSQLHYVAVEFVEPDSALFSIINGYLYQQEILSDD